MLRALRWAALPAGIVGLIAFVLHQGVRDVAAALDRAGWTLLWLVPFHALPLLLDAQGWRVLLAGRAPLGFLWWIAAVREAVSRLLPVASIGGEVVGVRLARWRVADAAAVSASVIVEVLVTIAVQYMFSALGIVLALASRGGGAIASIGLGLLLSMPLPVLAFVLVRKGGWFQAIERFAGRLLGESHTITRGIDGTRLDAAIDALMREPLTLFRAFAWQLAGYVLGALEVYWALALLGQPVSIGPALAIEALTQAVRHAAFMVPAGLVVQEAAMLMFATLFGVGTDAAVALPLIKRVRETVFGCIALASWQIAEMMRRR
ncbi:lysylphosphatidylglycerol synthase domain-containing protein [Caballeronia ptereochthonis]|uniref:lysylphosphatidylglycerol synthase domain-containing protein n=1 Tax=Caballeronia ptereochthonis TaxID=1777144 RepID=UPI000B35403C|nr:lysylphosphatidylglycerol synthase domain-containing protein [Caballeronia ptereochthonis]